MTHYSFAELTIHDPSWTERYVQVVTGLVERHGGQYLARTPRVTVMEGEAPAPGLALLIAWPSAAAAQAFYDSPEYAPFKADRQAGSDARFLLFAGEDVTGASRPPAA